MDMNPTSDLFGPHPDLVSRHRHLIRDLSLFKEVAPFVQHQYPNVHKLTIRSMGIYESRRDPILLELKETFPSLVQLTLTKVALTSNFWEGLEAYSRINTLRLKDILINADSRQAFWNVVENLEVLEMKKTPLLDLREKMRTEIKFYRMRKLLLDRSVIADISLIHLITRCPMLEDLEWMEYRCRSVQFHQALQHACWPDLKRLSTDFSLQDVELATLLQRIGDGRGKITQLRLALCWMETDTSAALGLHFSTLVEVNLADCHYVPSTTTWDLLCHCPRLEILQTRGVTVKGIMAGKPWVCQRLRKLRAFFQFEESEKGLRQEIFEHLSTLTRLEELTIHNPIYQVMRGCVLKFRLKDGMGQLASLQGLTSFQFTSNLRNCHADLGMPEVEWIKNHWKKLKQVKGSLNNCDTVRYNLKVAFEEHGIAVID
ncbi:hypothetical protein BGX34_001548 [Mortierella sp. NVP85]|nr:hypothetical protein BGX34_001548 [Mortierella sp. NVP85]